MERIKYDGLGDPIDPQGLYYIQCLTSSDYCSWWASLGRGYTTDLMQAGVFCGTDPNVSSDRAIDVPWPINYVKQHAVTRILVSTFSLQT